MSDRTVLVTGASRGIGRGIALAFAGEGDTVVLSARTASGLEETAAAAWERGASAVAAVSADLSDPDDCEKLIGRATEAVGSSPLVVVHCAGITENAAVDQMSLDGWNRAFQVNVTSALQIAGKAIPAMKEAGWGRFIAIGSLYSRMGVSHTAAYTSSKHALLGLIRVLSAELVGKGVTANAILPGFVDTEMVRSEAAAAAEARDLTVDEVIKKFLRIQPLGRMVTTEEVGALAVYLASDAGAPITGQGINIDGGAMQP
ncbi:MAG: SDR family oxidoreductase [Solirubrobacterales bacterium]|nr:SDR family oxidoreductase [Solirubrobacterales bacterium]